MWWVLKDVRLQRHQPSEADINIFHFPEAISFFLLMKRLSQDIAKYCIQPLTLSS